MWVPPRNESSADAACAGTGGGVGNGAASDEESELSPDVALESALGSELEVASEGDHELETGLESE